MCMDIIDNLFIYFHFHSHYYLILKWKQIIIQPYIPIYIQTQNWNHQIYSYPRENRNGNKIFILIPHCRVPNTPLLEHDGQYRCVKSKIINN